MKNLSHITSNTVLRKLSQDKDVKFNSVKFHLFYKNESYEIDFRNSFNVQYDVRILKNGVLTRSYSTSQNATITTAIELLKESLTN